MGYLRTNNAYWGTDFDPSTPAEDRDQSYFLADNLSPYIRFKNVIDGVVNEDVPADTVLNHFYHAKDGSKLSPSLPTTTNSAERAMAFFNQSIALMGGYTESAKHDAFYESGQALHHVENMIIPAHTHNDAENALFAPMLCCEQLKNAHVFTYTLRFLNHPRLALKQTDTFSNRKVDI